MAQRATDLHGNPQGTIDFSAALQPSSSTSSMASSQDGLIGGGSARPGFSLLLQPSSPLYQPPSSPFPPASLFPANDFSALLWTLHEPGTIALTLMYSLSFVVGFVGNLTSLRVLTNPRSRRLAGASATRSLLVNLAVCDLAVVCVCMPVTLGHLIYTAWVYGGFLCRAVPFTQAVSVSASVLTLTVISVNRYYSVRCPLRARSLFTRRRILATVGVVWAVSSAMCAPLAVMNRLQTVSFETFAIPVCQEEWPQPRLKQGYNVVLFVALYCIPVTFNLTIGFLTGRRLWGVGVGKRKTMFSDLDPRSRALHASRLKTRQKIAKMVVVLVLLFAVSWLPLYLADLWIDHEQHPPSWLLQTRPFAQWLGLTNSSLNPICYCFIGDLHRSAKVIRTRYHQRIAALFSSTPSASPAAAATAPRRPAAPPATERHGIAAATMAATASMATLPRLFSLGGGHGLRGESEPYEDSGGESDHSISDWYKSSPSVCDRTLLPGQPLTPHALPPRADGRQGRRSIFPLMETLQARRHSEHRSLAALPSGGASAESTALPSRRHSGDRGGTPAAAADGKDRVPADRGTLPLKGRYGDEEKLHAFPLRPASCADVAAITDL
ncbi:neuropeptide Y receptor type 2-like [Aplochiton taeniatus]